MFFDFQFMKKYIGSLLIFLLLLSSCATKNYRIQSITGSFVEIDSSFDKGTDPGIIALVDSYKDRLDKEMSVVIGYVPQTLTIDYPEMSLVHFTSSVMKLFGDMHVEGGVDFSLINIYAHRSALIQGPVTIGNMYEVYSYDSKLELLELKGNDLEKVFEQFVRSRRGGVSSNVEIVAEGSRLLSVTINGKLIDKERLYKIITIDYLAEGNDSFSALKNASANISFDITLRDLMIDYIKNNP